MANTPNTFPPKFSQKVVYPSIQNLHLLEMPYDDFDPGVYFNIFFPEFGINSTAYLTYGKHKFDIDIVPIEGEYTSQGYEITSENPPLKHGSRIKFEFKDDNNTVIFSDITPVYKTNGFTGYVSTIRLSTTSTSYIMQPLYVGDNTEFIENKFTREFVKPDNIPSEKVRSFDFPTIEQLEAIYDDD